MFDSVKNLLGAPKWSLLFIMNNESTVFCLHDESALRMLRYIGGYFHGNILREEWSLNLKHNSSGQQIPIDEGCFKNEGNEIALHLLNKIEICEKITQPKGKGPIFQEVSTKKKIPIPSPEEQQKEIMRTENSFMKVKKKLTFYSVMNDFVFTPRG